MYVCIIINFILTFLLLDFFNGIHNNYLGKKFKRSIIVVTFFFFVDCVVCYLSTLFELGQIVLLVLELVTILFVLLLRNKMYKLFRYVDVDKGKEGIFGDQRVMVFVPHEDDDINLMGGVIEEYIKYGSEVYVVFATNGDGMEIEDSTKSGIIRMNEAIRVLTFLGIPSRNIFFLGYGDGWDDAGPHIYNAEKEEILQSKAKRTATYGLKTHPAYHENKTYTYSHYYEDIKQLILEHKPDVLYCVDYDLHNDHRALSMLFEKVMGEILKTTDYRPMVYKGYAYRTAWNAPMDFYDSLNITSTVNNNEEKDVILYDWEERTRLPIDILSISRYLKYSKLYKALSMYSSQHADLCAEGIINGDKVFWKRRTDSLLYRARITVSSGDEKKLNDFMLLDCNDLKRYGASPYSGVWHPDETDKEKTVRVCFDSSQYIDCIVLYDNPSPKNNILNAIITTNDGECIHTGRLQPNGMASVIPIQKLITSFEVKIDEYEGDCFGFTEIEAYSQEKEENRVFCKLMDDKGNFVYDYIVPCQGEQIFKIYSNIQRASYSEKYVVDCDNMKCEVKQNGDEVYARCPLGETCHIAVRSNDGAILDSVVIRNPHRIERIYLYYCLSHINSFTVKKTYIHRIYSKFKSSL